MVCFALFFFGLVRCASSSYDLQSVMLACELVVVVTEIEGASEKHGQRPFSPVPDAGCCTPTASTLLQVGTLMAM